MDLWCGDCLELMKDIPSGSVDMILCDLPYGTTACKWDTVIPFAPLWEQYWRVSKPNAAVVLTSSQPFTTALIASQLGQFKYCWYWNKDKGGNFATVKFHPMKVVEEVCVFGKWKLQYLPQMVIADPKNKRPRNKTDVSPENSTNGIGSGIFKASENRDENLRHPKNLINIKSTEGECNNINRVHPTQKPVALMEYLIRTYTNGGETVLDNCMGSGTTGVACVNTNRKFIGIEKDPTYFQIAQNRINQAAKAKPS